MFEDYRVTKTEWNRVLSRFKRSFNQQLEYSLEQFDVCDIHPTSLFIQHSRIDFAKRLIHKLQEVHIELFEPICLVRPSSIRIVPPPIIENRQGKLVLCDGTHRITALREMGIPRVTAMLVTNTTLPLAGDVTKWEDITFNDNHYHACENFRNYNHEGFSGYSKFCNGVGFALAKGEQE